MWHTKFLDVDSKIIYRNYRAGTYEPYMIEKIARANGWKIISMTKEY